MHRSPMRRVVLLSPRLIKRVGGIGVGAIAGRRLSKAEALGAKTLVPPVDIPAGTFAWLADPDGNTIGLWKARS